MQVIRHVCFNLTDYFEDQMSELVGLPVKLDKNDSNEIPQSLNLKYKDELSNLLSSHLFRFLVLRIH